MFRRRDDADLTPETAPAQPERITSVLGDGTYYKGKLSGEGGVRIEGVFDGEIKLDGLLVVGTTGRVTCEDLRARSVIVAGTVRGDITANKVEIRASGRVWGNVTSVTFATEEGAFLRGQIQMEDSLDLGLGGPEVEEASSAGAEAAGDQESKQAVS
ncbi:MAG: polymer-forming cytoskeletal protein [Anaerolineales bacterium]|nr:polymer-forming cytoskeletal protein [Anaerolineales bacterium]